MADPTRCPSWSSGCSPPTWVQKRSWCDVCPSPFTPSSWLLHGYWPVNGRHLHWCEGSILLCCQGALQRAPFLQQWEVPGCPFPKVAITSWSFSRLRWLCRPDLPHWRCWNQWDPIRNDTVYFGEVLVPTSYIAGFSTHRPLALVLVIP